MKLELNSLVGKLVNSLRFCFAKPVVLLIPSFLIFFSLLVFHTSQFIAKAETTMLQAGVSVNKVPVGFYGTWRVTSRLISANNSERFKENNIDLWNLSRSGNVITLDNPFSGAHASITVDVVNGNYLKFRKTGNFDNQKLTDVVELKLGKETFTGTNSIKLDTISEEDGTVIGCDRATYRITGEKISGSSIK